MAACRAAEWAGWICKKDGRAQRRGPEIEIAKHSPVMGVRDDPPRYSLAFRCLTPCSGEHFGGARQTSRISGHKNGSLPGRIR